MEKIGKITEIGLHDFVVKWSDGESEMINAPQEFLDKMELGETVYQTDGCDCVPLEEPEDVSPAISISEEVNDLLSKVLELQTKEEREWFKKFHGIELNDRDAFYAACMTIEKDVGDRITCMDADQKMVSVGGLRMTFDDTYIEMCREAKEIQEQWKPRKADKYYDVRTERIAGRGVLGLVE